LLQEIQHSTVLSETFGLHFTLIRCKSVESGCLSLKIAFFTDDMTRWASCLHNEKFLL